MKGVIKFNGKLYAPIEEGGHTIQGEIIEVEALTAQQEPSDQCSGSLDATHNHSMKTTGICKNCGATQREPKKSAESYEQGYKDGESSVYADWVAIFSEYFGVETESPSEAVTKIRAERNAPAQEINGELVKALEPIAEEIKNTGNEYKESDWNPDAHIEKPITLTIREARNILKALERAKTGENPS